MLLYTHIVWSAPTCPVCTKTRDPHLSNERQMTALEALGEINRLSDIDMDSSDTAVDFDEEEDEQLLLIDPIHDQEDAGPSGTAKILPPTASLQPLCLQKKQCVITVLASCS
ncbi:hypothetical protein ILYODFUR_035098 [Ilyodon furcidens]|uniref:Uncharacterized protein n=1 Tax=Ilyodon furcidens TaxID=33524 RepID=A0ABV0SRQ5_9TELE